jgi:hypothetical protein
VEEESEAWGKEGRRGDGREKGGGENGVDGQEGKARPAEGKKRKRERLLGWRRGE